MKCPNCAFANPAKSERCRICGTTLEYSPDAVNDTMMLDEALKAIFADKIRALDNEDDELQVGESQEEVVRKRREPVPRGETGVFQGGDTVVIPDLDGVRVEDIIAKPSVRKEHSLIQKPIDRKSEKKPVKTNKKPVWEPMESETSELTRRIPTEEPSGDTKLLHKESIGRLEDREKSGVLESVKEENKRQIPRVSVAASSSNDSNTPQNQRSSEKFNEKEEFEGGNPARVNPMIAHSASNKKTSTPKEELDKSIKNKKAAIYDANSVALEEDGYDGVPLPLYEQASDSINMEDEAENLRPISIDDLEEKAPRKARRSKVDEILSIVIILLLIVVIVLVYIAIKATSNNSDPIHRVVEPASIEATTEILLAEDGRVGEFFESLENYLVDDETAVSSYFINPPIAFDVLKPLKDIEVTKMEVKDLNYDENNRMVDAHTKVFNKIEGEEYQRVVNFSVVLTERDFDVVEIKSDFDPSKDEEKRVLTADAQSETTSEQGAGENSEETTTTSSEAESDSDDGFDDGYFVSQGTLTGGASTSTAVLSAFRMGDHTYFHRLVFDFSGELPPTYSLEIADGGYKLILNVNNIEDFVQAPALPWWSDMLTDVSIINDSQNSISVVMTMSKPVKISNYTIDKEGNNPPMVVIDIRGASE